MKKDDEKMRRIYRIISLILLSALLFCVMTSCKQTGTRAEIVEINQENFCDYFSIDKSYTSQTTLHKGIANISLPDMYSGTATVTVTIAPKKACSMDSVSIELEISALRFETKTISISVPANGDPVSRTVTLETLKSSLFEFDAEIHSVYATVKNASGTITY